MDFINRIPELNRINHLLDNKDSMLLILYGRRRLGKTRLLQQIKNDNVIHYIADQSEAPLQIAAFSRVAGRHIKGFDSAIYPDWESCLLTLNDRLNKKATIIIDEFPYLVKNTPALPSIIQKLFDNRPELSFHLFLCGSSQQMMHNLALESTSPLYGRANERIKLSPLNIYWLKKTFNCSFTEAVEEYAVWGGVPRYWEIRLQEVSMKDAIIKHILDRNGILHEEPVRLFLDDSRDTIQMSTLISLIASGIHRLSEIASRMGKPSTHLNRPLQRLIELEYIKREIPFGISPRKARRSLYKVTEPFIRFYFSYVVPDKTSLEMGMAERIYEEVIAPGFSAYCSAFWEDICRASVPLLFRENLFLPGSRWWTGSLKDNQGEIDIVSASKDKSELIIAEAKWTSSVNIASVCSDLERKIKLLPVKGKKRIHKALFLKNQPDYIPDGYSVFTPEDVITAFHSDPKK